MQLFVLGMHRSGTSSVTRLLNMAGAYFGPEGISNGADEGNLKGFWERRDVRAICDGLLQESGFDWWRASGFTVDAIPDEVRDRHLSKLRTLLLEIDAHRPWVVKEPRLSLLFPLVRPLLEVPVCIHVVREPLEVAQSLETRNGFPVPAGIALWELYTIHAFRASAGLPRLLVRYDDLMSSPAATVGKLVEALGEQGVSGLRLPSESEITAYVSPDLHRARRSPEARHLWLNEPQARLAAAVDDGTVLGDDLPAAMSEGGRAALRAFEEDRLRQSRLAELTEQIGTLQDRTAAMGDRNAELERDLGAEARRRREVEEIAEEALHRAERDVRSYSGARTSRLAWRLTSLRRMLPGSGKTTPPLVRVVRDIERARRELDQAGDDREEPASAGPPTTNHAHIAEPAGGRHRRARRKVAVIAWDVGHNPLGRAHALAGTLRRHVDVEIVGAQFPRYGSSVWAPLRDSDIPVTAFRGRDLPEHLAAMEQMARTIDADGIYVSKPRLPSYALGILAKQARNRPLVLDVDDHELAFFGEDDGLHLRDVLALRGDPDLALPFGRTWTRACEPLVDAADQVTVSNPALQERFGGVVVPHARDERLFDPGAYDRDDVRRRLGVSEHMRLVVFGGTPRAHKGVVDVLRALDRLGDDRYRLLLFGTRELDGMRADIGDLDRWALPLPYQRFADLPPIIGAADLACVVQDPDHPVSRYQLPAKIVDALAMQVPCLVRPVPPLRSLLDQDVLHTLDDEEPLHERIASIFEHRDEAVERARRGRKVFEAAYSYEAVGDVLAPLFERLWDATPAPSPRLAALADLPRYVCGADGQRPALPPRRAGRSTGRFPAGTQYDVVMFWKQNDTGIYGRRQDMFLEYLARSGRVRSIVHFDSPTTPDFLVRTWLDARARTDQGRLVVRQTVQRLARRRRLANAHHRTFLHRGPHIRWPGLGAREDFPEFVRRVLSKRGIGAGPTIFWVYPTNDVLPDVIDALDPDLVVADVIDDHRTFHAPDSPHYDVEEQRFFETNYREVLARSDVVLANCAPVAESMLAFAPEAHVVPNGLEPDLGERAAPRPRQLRRLRGPLLGYVGNLSQRLDVPLLEALVRARPDWQFVFVGSAHGGRAVLRLASQPNVHFVGVKPYDEAVRFIQHFDVALIPHVDNGMTRSMNPLKAFVYAASGVPVVSTPIANLGDLADLITIARDASEFETAIEEALRSGRPGLDRERLAPHSWERRVEQAFDVIDRTVGVTPAP